MEPSITGRRWSFFTFIYNRSSNMNYFIYTSHHFTPHGKIWTQLIDLAPNVWLHSSVGRASHRYRGGHGFESRWSPDVFFRLLLSSCLSWRINCDDHSSLSCSINLGRMSNLFRNASDSFHVEIVETRYAFKGDVRSKAYFFVLRL